ncbi:putative sulfate exporter family transporter [Bacteroides acidifaciens]|nr:putative sulfate exporter family transporter [Bacteroides acidifaciens]MCR1999066.1 putative sulfate exporter family transporter [Bacteroides acidifaciens]
MFNEKRSSMLHGVLLIALFSCAAFYIGEMSFVRSLSFSPMIVGIILGMLYANSLRNHLPETWVPGIQFCSKKILRIGIILYGFRLTFQDVLAIGLPAMLIDVIIVVVTICGGIYIGKLLKMDRGIALLTSINSFDLLPAQLVEGINTLDTFLLTMAMTALGTETSIDKFRKAGAKPFVLALLLFIWLVVGGYFLVKYLTPYLM